MRKVFLSKDVCAQARDKLVELLETTDERGILVQHRAADSLMRHCLNQERYTPDEIDRRGKMPNSSSDIRELAAMSPEELLKLQAKMVGKAGSGTDSGRDRLITTSAAKTVL